MKFRKCMCEQLKDLLNIALKEIDQGKLFVFFVSKTAFTKLKKIIILNCALPYHKIINFKP